MKLSDAAALYRNQGLEPPSELSSAKGHKYSAKKKEIDGHVFDSTAEALAYRVLRQWEQHGLISELELQPRFVILAALVNERGKKLGRDRVYVADFRFTRKGGLRVVVDVKGVKTSVYSLKIAMFKKQYPHYIFEEWSPKHVKELAKQ
jgi:hypothetical protein